MLPRRVVAYDRPPFGLAERPLSWGGPGEPLQVIPDNTTLYLPG
jgi:hypothetical protein